MAEKQHEQISKFSLITGQDSYSSQNSQEPTSARRLKSLIPSISGLLTREAGEPKAISTVIPGGGKIGALYEYDFNNAGVKSSAYFASDGVNIFKTAFSAWTVQTDITGATITLTDYPQFITINNLMHVSDGTVNYIYDGPNNQWVVDGFTIPLWAPSIISTSMSGNITVANAKYYWFTFADQTTGRVHESSSSLISATTSTFMSKKVIVQPTPGMVTTTMGSKAVTGSSTVFQSSHTNPDGSLTITNLVVGMHLYIGGTDYGPIASVTDATHLTLTNNALASNMGVACVIAPPRTTHIHLYTSEIDGSRLGQYVLSFPITGMSAATSGTDNSPFITDPTSTILPINRPIRNDPAPASKILETHKYRIFRRRETSPNFFNYTANEEVAAGTNGSPQESVPGADVNTLSDLINETSYPKESNRILALKSHGDALFIATERETIPLYGDSIDSFGLSQVTAFAMGCAGRFAMISTPHGLVFMSYDRKVFLYPTSSYPWAYVPKDVNVTDQLIEIGRPMRNVFNTILSSDLANVRLLFYNYGVRNWLIVAFQDNTNNYQTWVYDFEIKSWFQLQRGFVSLGVFELTAGQKFLAGGGADGFAYVIDDQNGTFSPNTTLPSALYRPALIDFGAPEGKHIPRYIEMEVDNPALAQSITMNFYLDPLNADSPGNPRKASPWGLVKRASNMFRAWFGKGVICKRLLPEFNVASDTNAGSIRGLILKADPVSELG